MSFRGAVIQILTAVLAASPAAGVAARAPDAKAREGSASADTPPVGDAGAAEAYDRIGEAFRELEERLFAQSESSAKDDRLIYLETGAASAPTKRWLEGARRLGAELARASALDYDRKIDPSSGYGFGPSHLTAIRSIGRSLAILIQDAAMRSDQDKMVELLETQVAITLRTAGDGTLPTSTIAVIAAQEHIASVDQLLERAALDRASVGKILSMRSVLMRQADLGLIAAARGEALALQAEVDRLLRIPADERPDSVIGMRGSVAADFDDSQLVDARSGADAYLNEAAEALEDNDLKGAREEIAVLQERLRAGAFGNLLRTLAPQLLPTIDLLIQTTDRLEAQRVVLESLARGDTHPATYANAARLYAKAADACAEMSAATQNAIEELRGSSPAPTAARTHVGRAAIDAHRARIVPALLDAARAARCEFPNQPVEAAGGGLVREPIVGINGAVRVLLADVFGAGSTADERAREEAVIAALSLARHLAAAGSFSHSLAAQQVVRDLHGPLASMRDAGAIREAFRTRLAILLDGMRADDPFGYRNAFVEECARLSSQLFDHRGDAIAAFDRHELEALSPNGLAFLLAMFTPAELRPFDLPPHSPLDGALVDIRPWFDIDGFRRAHRQLDALRMRVLRDRDGRDDSKPALAQDATPLAWLDVTTPVDIVARTAEGDGEFEELRAIVKPSGIARAAATRPHRN